MKKFDIPQPVKLVCGILYHNEQWIDPAVQAICEKYGPVDFRSNRLDFNYTSYYNEEMGTPLFRQFVTFENLIDPTQIADVKVLTNSIEQDFASKVDGRRVFNLDPGYLNATAYILTTSKNYAHRIYLGQGVFAQQEILFERKRVVTLDWTYPDYRSYEYQEVFRKIRQLYMNQLDRSGS